MKYAIVYKRPRSPYWYVAYWCPKAHRRKFKATPFRIDSAQGRRKAQDLANEMGKDALADKAEKGRDRWEWWVDQFLESKYSGLDRAKTLTRMKSAWKQWRDFLGQQKVRVPRALTYSHVMAFIDWRKSQIKPASKKRVSKNTALVDVRCMGVILREALRREFCSAIVTQCLGQTKDKPAEKLEIQDHEIAKIREELMTRPKWMSICFEIAIHQGCRLSETSLPLADVNLENNTITFHVKGGKDQARGLHYGLIPLMRDLKSQGAQRTCELPRMAAKEWHFFFKEIGLPHLTFHCTRVTVITRLARAGVNIQQAMAYVGHADASIHKVYTRLCAADAGTATAALASLVRPDVTIAPEPPASPVDPVAALASISASPAPEIQAPLDLSKIPVTELLAALSRHPGITGLLGSVGQSEAATSTTSLGGAT